MTVFSICNEVEAEVVRARSMFSPFASTHEGYAVMLEEVDELWDEVKKKHPSSESMRKEAIQIAAMAVCFVNDITDKEPE